MAENDTAQHDRTEQPSTKRLDDARREGQVPRSRELSMMTVTLGGAAVLWAGQPYFADGLQVAAGAAGSSCRARRCSIASSMTKLLGDGVGAGLRMLAPLFIACLVASVVGSVALGGFSFSFESLHAEVREAQPDRRLQADLRLARHRGAREVAREVPARRRGGLFRCSCTSRTTSSRSARSRCTRRCAAPRGCPPSASWASRPRSC